MGTIHFKLSRRYAVARRFGSYFDRCFKAAPRIILACAGARNTGQYHGWNGVVWHGANDAVNAENKTCRKRSALRKPSVAAGMGSPNWRCLMLGSRLVAIESMVRRTIYGDRKIRAILGDCNSALRLQHPQSPCHTKPRYFSCRNA